MYYNFPLLKCGLHRAISFQGGQYRKRQGKKSNLTLVKDIKEETNKWKDSLCSWIGRINTVKMSILPEAICRFSAITINIPMALFNRNRKKYS